MKKILILLTLTLIIACNNTNDEQIIIEQSNKEMIKLIRNDLKLIAHNVKHSRTGLVEIFNAGKPTRHGRDQKPLVVLDGLNDINILINDINQKLDSISIK